MDKPFTLGGKEIYLADLEVGELINIMNNIVVAITEGNEIFSAEQLLQLINTSSGLIQTSEQKFIYYHWLVLELNNLQNLQSQGRIFSERGFWRAVSNSMYKAFDHKQPSPTGELDLTDEELLRLEYLQQELQKTTMYRSDLFVKEI
jgi:hypothetical protein